MPRTLPAQLSNVMDSGIYQAYIKVAFTNQTETDYDERQPVSFKLYPTRAEVTVPTSDLDGIASTYFRLIRGAVINGTPVTISSAQFIVKKKINNGIFTTAIGEIFSDDAETIYSPASYENVILNVLVNGYTNVNLSFEGTAAWKNYSFYEPTQDVKLNRMTLLPVLLKKKYLVQCAENGFDSSYNDIFFFCATDTRAVDYTVEDKLFTTISGTRSRRLLSHDENGVVTTDGSASNPAHNLGFIESTDIKPPNVANSGAGSRSSKLRVHLKYRTGDYVNITRNGTTILNTRIFVEEVFESGKDFAWYQILHVLEWFGNTETGDIANDSSIPNAQIETSEFDGILSDTDTNIQAALETIDDHDHSLAPIEDPTATNDFLVGEQIASVWTWAKKTLAQTITVLRTSLDSIYAPIANGVTNGNSHDHNGGDGAQIAHANLSGIGSNTHAQIDSHISNSSNPHGVTAAQTVATPESGWIEDTNTWTRTGNYTFTISGDVTTRFRKGTKIRYKDGGSYEYGVVISSSHAAGTTTITLATNDDYAMAAATITEKYISYIENPEGFPEWFNFANTISYSANGSMTYTSVSTTYAKFRTSGKTCIFAFQGIGTTGGTANNQLQASPPITILNSDAWSAIASVRDATSGNSSVGLGAINGGSAIILGRKSDNSNFGLGTGRVLQCAGQYQF